VKCKHFGLQLKVKVAEFDLQLQTTAAARHLQSKLEQCWTTPSHIFLRVQACPLEQYCKETILKLLRGESKKDLIYGNSTHIKEQLKFCPHC
jgi:hypothetical protein